MYALKEKSICLEVEVAQPMAVWWNKGHNRGLRKIHRTLSSSVHICACAYV